MNFDFEHYYSLSSAHGSSITSLAFNPNLDNNTILASASNDKYIKLWKLNQGVPEVQFSFKYHLFGINQIKWNQDGVLLASCGNDCALNVLDVTRQKINRNFRSESVITCAEFNKTSNLILAGTYDNQILLWDMRSKNIVSQILAHSEPITSVAFSNDSTLTISSSYDGFCRIWDVFKGNCLKTIVLENSPAINLVKTLPDLNYLLISSFNSQIQIIDLAKEEEIKRFSGHANIQRLVDVSYFHCKETDKYFIISGSEDGCVCVWDIEDAGKCRKVAYTSSNMEVCDIENKIINALSITNDGILCCAGYPDDTNSLLFYKQVIL